MGRKGNQEKEREAEGWAWILQVGTQVVVDLKRMRSKILENEGRGTKESWETGGEKSLKARRRRKKERKAEWKREKRREGCY